MEVGMNKVNCKIRCAVMDLDKIQAKGINDTVIAILLNTASYRVVSVENGQLVAQG